MVFVAGVQDATGMLVTVTVIETQTEIIVQAEDEAGPEVLPVDIRTGEGLCSPVRRGDHELRRHSLGNQAHPQFAARMNLEKTSLAEISDLNLPNHLIENRNRRQSYLPNCQFRQS